MAKAPVLMKKILDMMRELAESTQLDDLKKSYSITFTNFLVGQLDQAFKA